MIRRIRPGIMTQEKFTLDSGIRLEIQKSSVRKKAIPRKNPIKNPLFRSPFFPAKPGNINRKYLKRGTRATSERNLVGKGGKDSASRRPPVTPAKSSCRHLYKKEYASNLSPTVV